jgi:non-canonical (house-cleaning) NTP pyrophosphatase
MKNSVKYLMITSLLGFVLAACEPNNTATDTGAADTPATTTETTDGAAEDAGEAVDEAAQDAGQALDNAADETQDATEEAGDELEDATDDTDTAN